MELELITGGTPPVITSNFEALKTEIASRLAPYRIQVTEENLPEAKKLATELGKGATQLNKIKTEKAKEFSAPIESFKLQVMELVGMIQEGQDFLKKQVAVFEEKKRSVCLEAMKAALRGSHASLGVRPEFQAGLSKIAEMVGISKITPSGDLTKAARDSILALAQADRGMQDMVDGRLARLEAESLKSGLKTPLHRDHVKSFLLSTDEEYNSNLAGLIKIELDRQEKTLAMEKARMEKEAQDKAEKAQKEAEEKSRQESERIQKEAQEAARKIPEPIAPIEPPKIQPCPSPAIITSQIPNQKTKIVVICQFFIETDKTSPEQISATESWFAKKFSEMNLPPCKIQTIKGDK